MSVYVQGFQAVAGGLQAQEAAHEADALQRFRQGRAAQIAANQSRRQLTALGARDAQGASLASLGLSGGLWPLLAAGAVVLALLLTRKRR